VFIIKLKLLNSLKIKNYSGASMREDMLYNILVKSLGNPPKTINNKYVDKGDIFHSLQEMRPHDFFKETVG
jgi:aminopeptidase C